MKNVFLIGAMKSGTNTLYHALATHPAVVVPGKKELDYFVKPGADKLYAEHFPIGDATEVTLDGTTQYSKYPQFRHIPEAIYGFNRNARIIYLMRDPIDRYESNIAHFIARISAFPVNGWRESTKATTALDNSRYYTQIGPYLNRFGRDRVFLGAFEEFVSDQAAFLARVCDFLGLDPSGLQIQNERKNPRRSDQGADRFRLGRDDEKRIAHEIAGEVESLEYAAGVDLKAWWPRYSGALTDE